MSSGGGKLAGVSQPADSLLRDPGSEAVFALVGAVGADLEMLERLLIEEIEAYSFTAMPIRLSELLRRLDTNAVGVTLEQEPEVRRVHSFMDAGNAIRMRTGRNDFLALYAITAIGAGREGGAPRQRTAYLLRSIKHPDEARALRATYGPGFFMIGLHASEEERLRSLCQLGHMTSEEARELIERDQGEEENWGQQTRDAFQLADVFFRQGTEPGLRAQVQRFLRLVFGDPSQTPTPDEQGMFFAYAASTRSGDLSRQVGAALCREPGLVVSVGCNDVPAPGGGLYWPGPDDHRDVRLGLDANERHKKEILREVALSVCELLSAPVPDTVEAIETVCRNTRLFDITEFGRAVHAEMDALLAAARAGISPVGATLYTTTFPCHNCAKHIIAVGVLRVVYIEPYPKSQARDLHDDAIELTAGAGPRPGAKVAFEPFVGVGPRRYLDLFSLNLSSGYRLSRKEAGRVRVWKRKDAMLRTPMLSSSYLERERQMSAEADALLRRRP